MTQVDFHSHKDPPSCSWGLKVLRVDIHRPVGVIFVIETRDDGVNGMTLLWTER